MQIQADLEKGENLQRDRDAPAFVSKAINDLSTKWKDTNALAKAKHEKLKVRQCDPEMMIEIYALVPGKYKQFYLY